MKLVIEEDYEGMSVATARIIIDVIKKKTDALLCLAAGDTPRLTYSLLPEMAKKENVDLTSCRFVSLDEWVGIPGTNEGSWPCP